jgi:RNA polymerase sigma-70 factor (ECF subfamily)
MAYQFMRGWSGHHIGEQLQAMLPALNRFALTLTHSQPDADDLVQMTCEQALARLVPVQPEDERRNALFEAMRLIWIGELRGRQIQDRHAQEELVSPHRVFAQDGEAMAENRTLLQDLEQVMLRLPKTERRLLEMICVHGVSYKRAADITGVPIGTVMSRLARARLHLMDHINTDSYAPVSIARTN